MAQPRNQLWPFSERFENDRISDGTESTQLESEVCGDRRERNKIDGCISNRLATWCYCWGGSGTGMLLQLVVGALLCVNVSYTSTHWVVSDDGRLKSVDFSPYLMQEPGDLINFMKQEKRVEEASKLRSEKDRIFKEMSELSNTLADNSQLSSSEANDHEDENGSQTRMGPHNQGDELSLPTEANCSAMLDKNSPMTKEMDHYLSIHLPLTLFHISISDYLDLSQAPSLKPLMPFCNRPMNNPKDLKQFDKLKGFAESSSFEMKPEPDLRQVFDGKDVDRMGHLINEALLKKSDCWVVCSLATLFWRIKGNTQEALKCAKQAYDVSHSSKVPVALVNMAAILHKHHFHADASSLAFKALRLTDPAMKGFVHLLLAQIQCTPQMDQLEKCLKNLHAVLSCENHRLGIGPSHFLHNNIRDSIHAYSCLLRYKQQLEKEQNALEKFMQMQKEYHLVSELHAAKMKEIDSYKVSDDEYLLNEHLYKLHTNRQFSDLMDYFKDMEMSSEELERHLALSAGSPLDMEMRLTEEETYILSENPDGSVFLHTDALIEEDIDVGILCEEDGFDCHPLEFRPMTSSTRASTIAVAATGGSNSVIWGGDGGVFTHQTHTLTASAAAAAMIPQGAKIVRYGRKKYFITTKVQNHN